MDIESATNKCRRYIEERRQIVKLIPIVREVLRKFDGKVYNKRFNTALGKAIEAKHGKDFYFNAELSCSGEWLWISAGIYGHWSDHVSLCGCALNEGKRINAEKLIENCNARYSEILKDCIEIECNLDRMPEIVEQLSSLHFMQERIKNALPRHLQCEFHLDEICKYGR